MTGNKFEEHWKEKESKLEFFDIKAVIDHLLIRLGVQNLKSQAFAEKYGQGFTLINGKNQIIKVSSLHKAILKAFDIQQEVFVADINMDAVFDLLKKRKQAYQEPSKYPEVRRDLSMLLNKEVSFEALKKTALQAEQRLLKSVNVFDVYEGDKLPAGKKSYALSFILLDEEKTLQDQIIDGVMNKLISSFEKEHGAEIRKG
jgi:phenylalanyl-tRNA synthetase beta chain